MLIWAGLHVVVFLIPGILLFFFFSCILGQPARGGFLIPGVYSFSKVTLYSKVALGVGGSGE
jgi:hypothetical protein